MNEEELREKIREIIDDQLNHNLELICSSNYLASRILTLMREAGWKFPSEIHELIADAQEKVMGQLKEAGWKSPVGMEACT